MADERHNEALLIRELHAACDSFMDEDCEEHDADPIYWCLKCRAAAAIRKRGEE